jgi:AraC-like DNA-binding protein
MPIFMDRHDVSESVNAELVAQLHQEDLKIQKQFNCRGLTYWYDDIRKIAFCLIEAPDKESIHRMHNSAHGEVPNLILEVDEKIVESFLGRIEDPENPPSKGLHVINDPAQRTLMVVRFKIESLNGIRNSQSESNMQQAIGSMGGLWKQFGGRLTAYRDGYLLISFESAYKSVWCALEIETLFNADIAGLYNSNIRIHIGLATGMPVEANKTFFEDTVNMADRLCYIDKSNIVMTSEVHNLFATENLNAPFDNTRIYVLPISEEGFLHNAIDFIEKEWHNAELKVEDFEMPLGMSKTQVYRKFMLLTGKSPNSFLKEYRLNRALEIINKNIFTISEIAYETGFNSQSYFSKCFRRRFDLLPSDYVKT